MARPTSDGGSRSKKPSAGQQRILKEVEKAKARKQLTTLKGIGGIVGNAILEGVGGPKARAAGAAVKTSAKVARAVAKEAAGKSAKAPFGIYRKPAGRKLPRLRDTDNTPRKTTVRQQVGPKTKSGKFTEPKRQVKTNTQPPARIKTEKPKAEVPAVTKVGGRVISINKRATTPGARKRQEAQLRIGRREFQAERQRQAKLAARRGEKPTSSTREEQIIDRYYRIRFGDRSAPAPKSAQGPQKTIESRIASGAEKLDVTSRNASRPSGMSPAEWRAQREVIKRIKEADKSWTPGSGKPKPNMPTSRARSPKYSKPTKARFKRETGQ